MVYGRYIMIYLYLLWHNNMVYKPTSNSVGTTLWGPLSIPWVKHGKPTLRDLDEGQIQDPNMELLYHERPYVF